MNFYEHCNLCVNYKSNLQDGLICGLTDKKPIFNDTCPKIVLSDGFKRQLGLIHINIERLKKKTMSIYIYFLLATIIGCLFIISQKHLLVDFDFTTRNYRRLAVPFLIILVSFGMISFAFRKLIQHRKKTKTTIEEKDKIDIILDKYQIKYSCRVEFGEKYQGNQDVIVELKSNSNLLKDSKIKYSNLILF